jgi:ubiquitin-activating enzyme E1 C
VSIAIDESARWHDVSALLSKSCPLAPEGFDPSNSASALEALHTSRVLVIGAGGLGCELLKDLALSGFRNIDVIDMDTIDVSNLNRQFLFRKADVGKPKAEVAAAFVNRRVPGVKVTPHFGKIQDKDEAFYRQFKLVIAGLDSVDARRWINSLLINLVELDEDGEIADIDSIIPLIDGGTEGFKGHVRLILPRITACFSCALELFPPQTAYPMCTLANTPRLPEHCVEYVLQVLWPKERPNDKLDKDDPHHMLWLYEKSKARADEFGIEGVTLKKTQGVVKNIIPAIASTNAAVAAAEVNEAFKYITTCAGSLENYLMYNGVTGVYSHTFDYEKNASCADCGSAQTTVKLPRTALVSDLIELLANHPQYQLKKPSLRTAARAIYVQGALAAQMAGNLDKLLSEFVSAGEIVSVTDPAIPAAALEVDVKFED